MQDPHNFDHDRIIADASKQNWVDRYAPLYLQPYFKLSRIDRPIGTWLLLFPCWWAIALAAPDASLPMLFSLSCLRSVPLSCAAQVAPSTILLIEIMTAKSSAPKNVPSQVAKSASFKRSYGLDFNAQLACLFCFSLTISL